jgi:hypothetical protein
MTEGIDDLDVLDVQDSVLSIAEMFHIIPEAVIMLLLDGLQGFICGWHIASLSYRFYLQIN